MGDMTQHFSRWELACSCGCDAVEMNPQFMEKLESARALAGTSFTITSGFRCMAHPESIKRATSSHIKGRAVDILTPTSRKRSLVEKGLFLAKFNRKGIGSDFIHIDDDPDKEPDVTWTYYD